MIVRHDCPVGSLARRRAGFTLVELLTVVSIIALLIGILMPALSKARENARKVKTRAQLSAIEKSLELFHGDFNRYPDSSLRKDPIDNLLDASGTKLDAAQLSGAHWLARALIGHDFQGVDAGGLMLGDGEDGMIDAEEFDSPGPYSQRRGVYLDGDIYAGDRDSRFGTLGAGDFVTTGRPVVIDTFDFPILYYRANPRAMMKEHKMGYSDPASASPEVFVYNQRDNEPITGRAEGSTTGWDFAGTGFHHGIGDLENDAAGAETHDPPDDPTWKGKTFIDYLHNHSAHKIGGHDAIRPVNPDSFILISPGRDGLYGTPDDVKNFD